MHFMSHHVLFIHSERPAPLGLTPEEVLPTETEVKEFQETIIPRVALRIEEDRDKLLRFCQPKSQIQRFLAEYDMILVGRCIGLRQRISCKVSCENV